MEKEYIDIPAGIKYLNEVEVLKSGLPPNCIFNKIVPGSGGTTIALNNNKDYIICVPFLALINNKVSQYENVLGFTRDTSESDVHTYMSNPGVKKIMVTYNSLEKLILIIGADIIAANFCLLVDEYHILFTHYSFRNKAVRTVLNNYHKFNEFCFMSATKLPDEFMLNELKDIKVVEANWEKIEKIKVRSVRCTKGVIKTTIGVVNKFLSGEIEGNAYIFVNSLEFISKVIKNCKLTTENTRVIWSENNDKQIPGFTKGRTTELPKKINFLTSTCFEGADIYDTNGRTIIVSDNRKLHTLLDISTSIKQIAGRIRDSRYKDKIYHIYYANNRYDTAMSYEEFKVLTKKEIDQCKARVERINNFIEEDRIAIDLNMYNANYIKRVDGDFFHFDSNLVNLDLFNFKLTHHLYAYSVNIHQEYEEEGFEVEPFTVDYDCPVVNLDDMKPNFKEVVMELERDWSLKLLNGETKDQAPFIKYPFLREAIDKLGFKGISAEEYRPTNIKRKLKLLNLQNLSSQNQVFQALKAYRKLDSGDFIGSNDAKKLFGKVYKELGLGITAKGSDLGKYFDVRKVVKWEQGNAVRGFEILSPKKFFNPLEEKEQNF
jgi:hypothetical protein